MCERLVNQGGSGSRQYPPRMMLALVIDCYANGLVSSRRIERATYQDLAVRYLTGDAHPDHDTICAFRREKAFAIKQAFLELLRVGHEMGLPKVGTVSVDGRHIKANASKHKGLRYDRAGDLERKLPKDIARREALLEKMRWARAELEKRARGGKEPPAGGAGPPIGVSDSPPPKDTHQINLTDPDSALMRTSRRDSDEQADNAQGVVDVGDSRVILGTVQRVLADGGYVNAEQIESVGSTVELYVAISCEDTSQRRYD